MDSLPVMVQNCKEESSNENTDENEELSKIKGDAIGDTLYSERWVLRVLIKMSDFTQGEWNKDLEEELCSLWDMTAEKDVVLFLMQNDFYSIFCKVIRVTNNARCIEIMAGILGNMCCVDSARDPLAEHEAGFTIINLITSEDSLVLVQVVRLLNTCLWSLRVESPDSSTRPNSPILDENEGNDTPETQLSPWLSLIKPHKELLLHHLGFFLSSAINEDLLCSSLELLDTLLAIPSLAMSTNACVTPELASGLVECLRQLLRGAKVGDSLTANRKLWRALQVWMGLVGHVASCQEGRINLGSLGDLLAKCFTKLILLLTTPEALRTQEPEMATLCLCVLETLPQVRVSPRVLALLVQVLCKLDEDIDELIRDSESVEVRTLLHRSVKFLTIQLECCDDIVPILQCLERNFQTHLLAIVYEDDNVRQRVERGLLQITTNGLVQ